MWYKGEALIDTIVFTLSFTDHEVLITQEYNNSNFMTTKSIIEYERWGQYKQI